MAVQFSIDSQASSHISEAITAPNMNIKFEIRNNMLDQPLGKVAKMTANGIQTRDRPISFFFLKPIPIFSIFFTDICPAAYIRLVTDIDNPKFAAYRHFNKEFWLNLM